MRTKIKNEKENKRYRRHLHIRKRVSGTAERPRVCLFRSNKHIYAQLIDDETGATLAAVSSLKLPAAPAASASAEPAAEAEGAGDGGKKKKKGGKKKAPEGAKILQAREVGRLLAEAAKEKGITRISFDRGGYLYHGRVAALADSARKNGLEF